LYQVEIFLVLSVPHRMKTSLLTKDRNALSNEKGIVLFRAGQNLKHLHHARKVIKGKVYGGVINSDCDLAE
jgi:hypothetical protein